jgi:hypothetical protein
VIGGVPQYTPTLPTLIINKRLSLEDNLRLISPSYNKISVIDARIKELALNSGARYFSSLDAFCNNEKCLATSRFEGILMPIAWDYGHLTSAGSVYLSTKFKSFFTNKNDF